MADLEAALKDAALTAFVDAMTVPAVNGKRRVLLAVDTKLQVVLDVLASGAGGHDFYTSLDVERIIALPLSTAASGLTTKAVQSQLRLDKETDVAVVFLAPPIVSVAKLIADVARDGQRGHQWHVVWLPAAASDCALELERQGVADLIQQHNLFLGLLPIDTNVATLCDEDAFANLYVRGDYRCLTQVTRSLLSMEALTGATIPDMICIGPMAQRVKRMVELARPVVARGTSQTATTMHRFDKVIIIDRLQDPLSLLVTPMTYEGLLDALVGMDHGVVWYDKDPAGSEKDGDGGVSKQKVVLNHLDELYVAIRDVNFNLLTGGMLVNLAQSLVSEARGGTAGNGGAQPTVAQLTALLKKVPDLVKKKRSLSHHLELVQRITQLSKKYALRSCIETEMAIMAAGKKASSATAKDVDLFLEEAILRDPPMDCHDVVQLLCLCCLLRGGLKEDKLLWYRKQLCHTHGHQVLPLLLQLEKLGWLSTRPITDFSQARRTLALMNGALEDDETVNPTDIHFMFPYTGYAPMSVRLVQHALGVKLKSSVLSLTRNKGQASSDSYDGRRSSLSGSIASMTSAAALHANVLVFYIGGTTVAEIEALRFLNGSQSQFSFFVATTAVCNGRRLLRSI